MISNSERGNKAIKIENLIKISDILGVSTDYILPGRHSEKDMDAAAQAFSQLSKEGYRMIELLIEYCRNK